MNNQGVTVKHELIEQFDEQEYLLAKQAYPSVAKDGAEGYYGMLCRITYPIAKEVARMSYNERLVFNDALKRFEAIQGGSK